MNLECLIIFGRGVVWPPLGSRMSFCKENVKTRFLHLLVCRESAPARKINCVFNVNNVWSSLRVQQLEILGFYIFPGLFCFIELENGERF